MNRYFASIALFASIATPASAATLQVISGSQRGFVLPFFGGAAGQSFTSIDTNLTSFGFQFGNFNPANTNDTFTWTLRSGAGLTGATIATRTFTLPTSINTRNATWFDFDVTGTTVSVGQVYTAVLTTTNTRHALFMGPDININTGAELTGDAYTGGRAFFAQPVYSNCAMTGNCDLNFRVTGNTPQGAIPEPATWAMLVSGFGLAGAALRSSKRRRALSA
jgi:PEP-CTERM motif